MRYVRLGGTGLRISEVILGCLSFGQQVDEAQAQQLVEAALDVGITTFDTGDSYNKGLSERFLGRALQQRRHDVVICTKVALRVGDGPAFPPLRSPSLNYAERWRAGISPNSHGLSRGHIMDAVDASLQRLGTDYIDLYQVHEWDVEVPIEETLRALDDVVRAGKARYIGCSRFAAWQLYRALWTSDRHQLARFESVLTHYNLFARESEDELIPACTAESVGVLAFRVLGAGILTGRYDKSKPPPPGSRMSIGGASRRYWRDDVFAVVEALQRLGAETGRTSAQLALGWVLANPKINAALLGAENVQDLKEIGAITERPLTLEEIGRIEDAVPTGAR
jgi:aryl-alcohol dehydrogenase-like predicted oxidoreductase